MIQLAYIDTQDGHKQKKRYIQPKSLAGESFGVHLKKGGSFYFKCTGVGYTIINGLTEYFFRGIDTEGTDLYIDESEIDMVTGVDVK
jgi:hypothetical protein